jgi:hypothetical protein
MPTSREPAGAWETEAEADALIVIARMHGGAWRERPSPTALVDRSECIELAMMDSVEAFRVKKNHWLALGLGDECSSLLVLGLLTHSLSLALSEQRASFHNAHASRSSSVSVAWKIPVLPSSPACSMYSTAVACCGQGLNPGCQQ